MRRADRRASCGASPGLAVGALDHVEQHGYALGDQSQAAMIEPHLAIVRAELHRDDVERAMALQARQQIGRAVEETALDRIGMHGGDGRTRPSSMTRQSFAERQSRHARPALVLAIAIVRARLGRGAEGVASP